MKPLRILSLQPYYAESHRAFVDAWIQRSRHEWEQLTLPGRHWKWRMRHAAIEFASEVRSAWDQGKRWDLIFTTDMCNVAELRGLMQLEMTSLPIVCYFHENQLAYPNRKEEARDQHFAFTNLTTALAADECWFNSRFNLESMIKGLEEAAKHWPDYPPLSAIASIRSKARVVSPPIATPTASLSGANQEEGKPLQIVWAARWEHDKNPEDLYRILNGLEELNAEFRISLIGQQFRMQPPIFSKIKQEFASRIDHYGFQESPAEYWKVLCNSDVILSTANHEFFGISVAEALSVGCMGVLPNRLAYPEFASAFPDSVYCYDSISSAVDQLFLYTQQKLQAERKKSEPAWDLGERNRRARFVSQKLSWETQLENLDQQLVDVVA